MYVLQVICEVAKGTPEDVNRAVEAAKVGFVHVDICCSDFTHGNSICPTLALLLFSLIIIGRYVVFIMNQSNYHWTICGVYNEPV